MVPQIFRYKVKSLTWLLILLFPELRNGQRVFKRIRYNKITIGLNLILIERLKAIILLCITLQI